MYRTAVTLAALMMLVGCARSSPEPAATVPPATATVAYITPTATPVPPPTPTATPEPEPTPAIRTKTNGVPMGGSIGLLSLEENIVWADVIARVRFRSVASAVEPVDDYHAAALVFTFDVLEYLKGTGVDSRCKAVVDSWTLRISSSPTEEDARELLPSLLADRDTRWDSREAVVLLVKTSAVPSTINNADRYFMGYTHFLDSDDGYTVASPNYRAWLPDANPSPPVGGGGGRRSVTEQRFLLADPVAPSAGTRSLVVSKRRPSGSGATGTDTITLSDLRAVIGAIDAEIAAGDGSEAYRRCVDLKYKIARAVSEGLFYRESHAVTMRSGAKGGHVLHSDNFGLGTPPDGYGRHWTTGAAQDLFGVKAHSPRTNTPDSILYAIDTVALRPLPAGTYRFRSHELPGNRTLCGQMTEAERNHGSNEFTVTVTPPSGTAAEALFDPVALDGVSAISTARWFIASGSPSGTAVGAVKWKAGTLSVELTPATSFGGHHLDFIAQDGTLAETVAVDDATRTGDTLSWAVATAPWAAGDKMMVRLYRVVASTCTVADGAMKPGACYQDPVFAGAP